MAGWKPGWMDRWMKESGVIVTATIQALLYAEIG
jgi:hypothetical protein